MSSAGQPARWLLPNFSDVLARESAFDELRMLGRHRELDLGAVWEMLVPGTDHEKEVATRVLRDGCLLYTSDAADE